LIFERTGGVVKAHRGVHSEFARLARDGPNIDKSFPVFLTQAYNSESRCRLRNRPGLRRSARTRRRSYRNGGPFYRIDQ
jgi:hypothetical protein